MKANTFVLAAGVLMMPFFVAPSQADAQTGRRVRVSGMTLMTVTGMLTRDADDKNFDIRDAYGRNYSINVSNYRGAQAANKLQKGQMVRVSGEFRNDTLYARNLRLMSSSAISSASGTRVYYAPYRYVLGARHIAVGRLITDADDDEFEIRSRRGRTYRVRTRNIPDRYGLNRLRKGQRVRVYGRWIRGDRQPQLEASRVVVLRR